MKKHFLTLAAVICCAMFMTVQTSCTTDRYDNPVTWQAKSFVDQIREVETISNVTEINTGEDWYFKERYLVEFEQPIDHKNPKAGTFKQRALICYKGSDRPTILYTCGYELRDYYLEEPDNALAYYMNANLIYVEHRYFGESTVTNDPRWDYLTIEQAAGDHHNIVQARGIDND